MIHLADTFGFSVDAGVMGFLEGLSDQLGAHVKGNIFLSRNYTHLKPLRSIKKSLQEPVRHILVNLYQKRHRSFGG